MNHRHEERSDTQLVADAAAGDPHAFGELVERHRRLIGHVLGRVPEHLRKDAEQEALLAIWQGLSRFEHRSSVSTWMYSVVIRRAQNVVRSDLRARRRDHRAATSADAPTGTFTPSAEAGVVESDVIRTCMSALTVEEQELLDRHYGLGTPVDELAAERFVSAGAIRKAFERARSKLTTCLQRRRTGGESEQLG